MSDLMGGFMHAIETINGGPSSSHESHPEAGVGKAAHAYEAGFQDGKNHQVGICYPAPYDLDYETGYAAGNAALEKSQGGIMETPAGSMTLAQKLQWDYDHDPRSPILKDKDPKYESLGGGFPEDAGGPEELEGKYGNEINFGHSTPNSWYEGMFD